MFTGYNNGFPRTVIFLAKGKITKELVRMLLSWQHSGFNIFCGERIYPGRESAMENLARYIIRASFSEEWITYAREEAKIIYQSKGGKGTKTFDALEWLAAMCSHVPEQGRTDGEILWLLQQCPTWQTGEGKYRWTNNLSPRTER